MNPYAIIGAILLAIAAAAGGYSQGWEKRGDHEASLQLEAKKAADKMLAAEKLRGDGLALELEQVKREVRTVTVEVIKEIPKVTTVYREAPNAPIQAIPDPVYTYGFVRLWDHALAGVELPNAASQPADPTAGTDLLRARIGSADVLTNHAENASKYAECRAQLNALIDWHEGRAAPAVAN